MTTPPWLAEVKVKEIHTDSVTPAIITNNLPEDLNLDETTSISATEEKEETTRIEAAAAKKPIVAAEASRPVFVSTGKKNFYINNTKPAGRTRVYQVSYAHRDKKLPQIEILTTKKVIAKAGILKTPRRLVIDLPNAIMDVPKTTLTVKE